jgi:hypothetical protein
MVTTILIAVYFAIASVFPLAHVHVISEMSNEIAKISSAEKIPEGPSIDYLMPGSPSLNYDLVTPGEYSYIVFEENDSERVFVGTLTERLVTTTKEDRPFLVRIQEIKTTAMTRQSMVMTDINAGEIVFDAISDDQYIATHNYAEENEILSEFNFSDKQTESLRTEVQFPVFSAEAIDVIVRSIPLFDGYKAHFIGYDHRTTDLFTPITLSVEKLETITAHEGKTHRTWKVNAVSQETEITYYVDKYSRQIVRIELKQSPDKLLVMEQL